MSNNRFHLVFFGFIVLFIILGTRLFFLSFKTQETDTLKPEQFNTLLRGTIYSANKDVLGISLPFYSIYINPDKIDWSQELAYANLFGQLGLSDSQSQAIFNSNKKFRWLSRMVPKETFNQLQKVAPLSLPGVTSITEYKRGYPYNTLASHILGFTNIDGQGIAGIEYSMNSYLLSHNYIKKDHEDINPTSNNFLGYDIVLTIDSKLQWAIESIISKTAEELQPKSISSIIMEADTGKILSMASYPTFDPNIYNTYNDNNYFINTSLSVLDEPGSTFKPLMMLYLFDHNFIDTSSRFISKGQEKIDGFPLRDASYKSVGTLSPRDILIYSSNIGIAKASQKVPVENFYQFLTGLNFDKKTQLQLPGEQKGLIRSPKHMTNRSKIAIPIGQEFATTPLQLVTAFTVLANNGVYVPPRIIERLEYEGSTVNIEIPELKQEKIPLFTKENSQLILSYMRDTVLYGGSKKTDINGEWIAAKTGTAQIFDIKTKGYTELNASIMAIYYSDTTKKRYILYGVIRSPQVDEQTLWGGTLAAPMIKEFIKELIKTLNKSM